MAVCCFSSGTHEVYTSVSGTTGLLPQLYPDTESQLENPLWARRLREKANADLFPCVFAARLF